MATLNSITPSTNRTMLVDVRRTVTKNKMQVKAEDQEVIYGTVLMDLLLDHCFSGCLSCILNCLLYVCLIFYNFSSKLTLSLEEAG